MATDTHANRWPAQIKYIIGNEACERFSYYGMKSVLAGYVTSAVLKGGLGQSDDTATSIIHLFVFANYFMPLFGAWLSDRWIGRYNTILWVSLFYCAGHGVLACSDLMPSLNGKLACLYTGLALIAFGSGGIKPCVAAFVGDQFRPDQGHLLQKAYGAFYWSINFGSFFSFLAIPWIKDTWGYSLAFGVPGFLMGIATLIFWFGRHHYVNISPSHQSHSAGFCRIFWSTLWARRTPTASFWDSALNRYSAREVDAAKSVLPILFVFALIPIFWSLFDQINSTWVLQGQQMVPVKLGQFTLGAEQMQSANPLLVMILVPLFTLVIYPRIGRFTAPLRRMTVGMFLGAFSYLIVAVIQSRIEGGAQLSILHQFAPYLVLTAAEVLISTTGLEFAFREAAPEMKSTIMSFWLLTVAFGNLLVAVITTAFGGVSHSGSVSASRFLLYAVITIVVAILFSLISRTYRYRDEVVVSGKMKL